MTEEASTEIELNFRLDENGRTAPTTTTAEPSAATTGTSTQGVDYRSQTVQTTLRYGKQHDGANNNNNNMEEQAVWDELLLDCEIADSGLMPRTFWMPCAGTPPRCSLEQFAWQIFHHHVPADLVYDKDTSGAEWWVQIRPAPSGAGRYAMHAAAELNDEISRTGIWFHWDKDEDLRQLMGGDTTYIHPHISTVTYLTSHGAPTLCINRRIHPLTGEWIARDDKNNNCDDQAWISWPKRGKHLSFDGRFLHAAPPDLLPDAFRESSLLAVDASCSNKIVARRSRRVTFLVNIWLNYHPLNVHPFPMLDKMSGKTHETRVHLSFSTRAPVADVECSCRSTEENGDFDKWKSFEWPMGGCDSGESVSLTLPLEKIQQQHKLRGNVSVIFSATTGGVILANHNPHNKLRRGEKRKKAEMKDNSQQDM